VPSSSRADVHGLPEALSYWPGYLLAFVAERATERFEREIARHGIRSKHAQVLLLIDAEGPMSQRDVGRRLRIDKSPMVGLLDDLERLELAERRRSDADRRVQAVNLTEDGRDVLASVIEIAEAENARTFGVLEPSEREVLHDLLRRVAEADGRRRSR